jgi:uncharacterized protein (TIGR02246 family)
LREPLVASRAMLRLWFCVVLLLVAMLTVVTPIALHSDTTSSDSQNVEAVIARFFDGWNAHDANKMVSTYAEDIDHIDVFGEWHKGREVLRTELARLHAGPLRDSQKTFKIEKIRFLGPDVAVAQVSSLSKNGPNLGTFVLQKRKEGWLTVSFTNVAPHDPPWKK